MMFFWKAFYESSEKFFLPGFLKEYFVFTDSSEIFDEDKNPRIHKIYQERMGWPFDTLKRFHLFASIEKQLSLFDYIFFFNANAQITKPIEAAAFLPDSATELLAVVHPGYFDKPPSEFTYESKQKKSTAYIPKGNGKYYFAGGINGGLTFAYLKLIHELKNNIDADLKNNIIAMWHDESHLNHYLLNKNPKILSPSFLFPEGWDLPFEPIILIRDKTKYGGHELLRDVVKKITVRKRISHFIKKILNKLNPLVS